MSNPEGDAFRFDGDAGFPVPGSGELGNSSDLLIRKILVPIDFSQCSGEVLGQAVALARVFKAEIILLHVVGAVVPELKILEAAMAEKSFHEEATEELTGWQRQVPAEVVSSVVLREGKHPYREILAVAEEQSVDLIVIGRNRLSGLERFLLGSTADQVCKHAYCPVLVAG